MSGHERRGGPSPHWPLTSMVGGVAGVLYAALSPFGRDAWASVELLLGLAGMIVLLIPAGAALGLMCGLVLWAVLSPLAARSRKAPGCQVAPSPGPRDGPGR
jgi:hypothetical protein